MAFTSACAVGSLSAVTRLTPVDDHVTIPDHHCPKRSANPAQHVLRGQPDSKLHEIILGLHVHFRLHSPEGCPNIRSMTHAFVSSRVVTPEGVRPAAIMVEQGRIQSVRDPGDIPCEALQHAFGDLVLLPGLVDSHVHINEPGRTEWEGFATATRAAAAGGYTTLVDMPLNCLPETTTVAALEAKRVAAGGQCWVDWAPWGGLTGLNGGHLAALAEAGVAGFKCFLINPGIDGFAMIEKHELEAALPALARTGLPLLVHAELAEHLSPGSDTDDWNQYATYLRSRPDEAELAAIRMLIGLCRRYSFPLHIVHLSTALALPELAAARSGRTSHHGRNLSSLPALFLRRDSCRRDTLQMCPSHPFARESRSSVARAPRRSHRPDRYRSLALPSIDEAGRLPPGLGRHCQP